MPREERSAGFVIFHAPSDAPRDRQYLLLDHGKHWDYPKGHVEPGESDLDAAIRELEEETGLTHPVVVPEFRREITYFFRNRNRQLVRKTVVFFLGEIAHTAVKLSDEHVDSAFLPYLPARAKLTYAAARDLLDKAEEHLTNRQASGDAS